MLTALYRAHTPALHSATRVAFSTALQYDRFSVSAQQAPWWVSKIMHQVIVSDLNRTPIVQIITWFTLTASLLAFLTHAAIKFYVFRSLTTESWFVLVSLVSLTPFQALQFPTLTWSSQVFCVAQSAAVSLQAHYGFGTPMASLSDYQIESNLKVSSLRELCVQNY